MAAPRRHTSIALVACLVVFGCKGRREEGQAALSNPAPAQANPDATEVRADGPAEPIAGDAGADRSGGSITISGIKPTAPGSGYAKRCAIGGVPLTADCVGGSEGLAFDKAGILYVANELAVHRYRVTPGDPCRLDPAGEPIEMPAENPRPQPLGKGPVYMRSGGAAWHLVGAGNEIYAHDYLTGLFRVDRGKPEPICNDVFGYGSLAKLGKRLLVRRKGVEELVLGARGACKARSAGIDDKVRDDLYAFGGALYAAGNKIHRYDKTTATQLAENISTCAITAMTTCGDGVCAIDHNCPAIVQLAADGTAVRQIDGHELFDARPWALVGAATGADGTVYLHARHRDKVGGKDVCEAAVYAIPPAVFAR